MNNFFAMFFIFTESAFIVLYCYDVTEKKRNITFKKQIEYLSEKECECVCVRIYFFNIVESN